MHVKAQAKLDKAEQTHYPENYTHHEKRGQDGFLKYLVQCYRQ